MSDQDSTRISHERARGLLGDLLQARLSEPLLSQMTAHLTQCAECREVAETYEYLRQGLTVPGEERESVQGSEDAGGESIVPGSAEERPEHPPSLQLARWVFARGELTDEQATEVEAHLAVCESCADEVTTSMELLGELYPPTRLPKRAPKSPAWLLAAAIILALLGVGAWVATWLVGPSSRLVSAGGVVELQVLEPPLRGAESSPRVVLNPAVDAVLLGLPIDLHTDVSNQDDAWQVLIADRDGKEHWSLTTSRGELLASSRGSGIVTFLVPSSALEPGDYVLSVGAIENPLAVDRFPFVVVTPTETGGD